MGGLLYWGRCFFIKLMKSSLTSKAGDSSSTASTLGLVVVHSLGFVHGRAAGLQVGRFGLHDLGLEVERQDIDQKSHNVLVGSLEHGVHLGVGVITSAGHNGLGV